jgi:hypothetical protein
MINEVLGRPSFLIVSALLVSLSAPASPVFGATLEQLLNKPFFDRSDIEAVRKGGFGVAKIREVSDRELAVVIACVAQVPSEEVLAPFLGDTLPVDESHLVDQRLIDPASPAASFEAISLDGADESETRYFLEARPGLGLNLSRDEIAAFEALRGTAAPAVVESAVEKMLHARYLAYRQDGLAGAIPYARENGEHVSPGAELRQTEVAMVGLHKLYPEFHDAWLRYPSALPEDIVRDDYFWLKLDVEDLPTFVLSHRLEVRNDNMHLVGVRDFYMSHFFDVSQRVAVVTRLESGEDLLIYIERAWVDYWTGLAAIKRKIGRKVLTKQMEHLLEEHGICGG